MSNNMFVAFSILVTVEKPGLFIVPKNLCAKKDWNTLKPRFIRFLCDFEVMRCFFREGICHFCIYSVYFLCSFLFFFRGTRQMPKTRFKCILRISILESTTCLILAGRINSGPTFSS